MGTGQRRSRQLSGHLEKRSLWTPECNTSQVPRGRGDAEKRSTWKHLLGRGGFRARIGKLKSVSPDLDFGPHYFAITCMCVCVYIGVYLWVVCTHGYVCVCRLSSEALTSTDFHLSSHRLSQNLFPLSWEGEQNCGRSSRIPGLLSDPRLSATPRWCPQLHCGADPRHSPRPWRWIGPDYIVLLLKVPSVLTSG